MEGNTISRNIRTISMDTKRIISTHGTSSVFTWILIHNSCNTNIISMEAYACIEANIEL